jgi:ABC-type Na+ efflux pump permease subunit
MGESGQLRAVEAVGDWCKWLVGVNLTAAGGCVAVLQTGVGGTPRLFLLAAIGLFVVGLLSATVILALLPRLLEQLPVQDDVGQLQSIYEGQLWRAVRLRPLVVVQFVLFVLALLSFAGWVLTKPAPG